MNKGIFYAIAAYLLWGFFPIYWKALDHLPATEILGNRIVWSLFFVLGLLLVRRKWSWLKPALGDGRVLLTFFLSGTILTVNWYTYIWGVNIDRVVETSLGYFINPLVSVLLGVLFLRERLRWGQWTAVVAAAIGVAYLTILYGQPPWIAIILALSFGIYGFIRKIASLPSLEGLFLETAILFLPALLYLVYLQQQGGAGDWGQMDGLTIFLLILSGVVTAVPLLLFSAAARLIPLSSIGILQYVAPVCQFLIGVFLYNEPFSQQQLIGFSFIWLALIVYSVEGVMHNRKQIPTAVT